MYVVTAGTNIVANPTTIIQISCVLHHSEQIQHAFSTHFLRLVIPVVRWKKFFDFVCHISSPAINNDFFLQKGINPINLWL